MVAVILYYPSHRAELILSFSNKPRLDEKELEIRRLKARISELEEEREI